MSKEMKKDLALEYEELSDHELAFLSGGAQSTFTDGNPNNGPYGQEKDSPRPNSVDKRQTKRF